MAEIVAEPPVDAPVFGFEPEEGGHLNVNRKRVDCHDIAVFAELKLAAAACLSEAQLWDISNPLQPKILKRFNNRWVQYWHSESFSWNGKRVVFSDEPPINEEDKCSSDSMVGRLWVYDVNDPSPEPKELGSFQIPARPRHPAVLRAQLQPDPGSRATGGGDRHS